MQAAFEQEKLRLVEALQAVEEEGGKTQAASARVGEYEQSLDATRVELEEWKTQTAEVQRVGI